MTQKRKGCYRCIHRVGLTCIKRTDSPFDLFFAMKHSGIDSLDEPIKNGLGNDIGNLIGERCRSFKPEGKEMVVFT